MPALPPAYRVDDRSILLPHYKRLLVEPVLPHLPRRLSPNAITHAGHLVCLAALGVLYPLYLAPSTWKLAVSALLVHLYLWCDNADGAHARRTGQASTAGEYLDHGLDIANCTYIGVISACTLAVQGTTLGLIIASIIPCAAAITVWEQAMTGVFRLGLLNQIESLVFLTAVMTFDAIFGIDRLGSIAVLGHGANVWIWGFVIASVGFGIARSIVRVFATSESIAPAVALLALLGAGSATLSSGALAAPVAHALCATSTLWFGTRFLRTRIARDKPKPFVPWVCFAVAALVLVASRALPPYANPIAGLLAVTFLAPATMNVLVIARRATAPRRATLEHHAE